MKDKQQNLISRRDLIFRKLPAFAATAVLAACEPLPVTYQNQVDANKGMSRLRELGMVGELDIVSLKEVLGPDSTDLKIESILVDQFLGSGGRVEDYLVFAWKDNSQGEITVSRLPVKSVKFEKLEKEDAKPTFHLGEVDLRGALKSGNPKDLNFVRSAVFSLPPRMNPVRKS